MWDMFGNSLRLFVKGKLFREPRAVFRQWLIGFVIAVLAVVALAKVGAPTWVAVALAAAAVGLLQPFLFKNLKYA
jgi:membrane associated rhomboid family serine protease